MSPRLDLPLAVLVWTAGFLWIRQGHGWLPFAGLMGLAAARLLIADASTRRLLRLSAAALWLALGVAAAMVGSTYALFSIAVKLVPAVAAETEALYRVLQTGAYSPLALSLLVVAVSALEEVVWRGRTLRPGTCLLVPSLLYALAHAASGSVLLVLVALACGLAWGAVRLVTGSLTAAILTHALWDVSVLALWPLG